MYDRSPKLHLGVFISIVVTFCEGELRPPIIRKVHHKPHHSMFSADPAPCSCVTNGQPVIKDGFLSDDKAKGNPAMSGPIVKGVDVNGEETYYPANYGNKCEAWDQMTDPVCQEKIPPAYCQTRWCFVAPECAKADTQKTWRFPGSDLHYSYEACGSFDAISSYKCHDHDSESDCVNHTKAKRYVNKGASCEWSEEVKGKELVTSEQICQPDRCRCNGDFLPIKQEKGKELYGSKCGAWDRTTCEEWQDQPGAKMGIWCCQSWCYVDSSCPSAAPSIDKPSLYYSYVACEDDLKELKQCPWPQATGWQGSPAILSEKARKALDKPKKPKKGEKGYIQPGVPKSGNVFEDFAKENKILMDVLTYPIVWGVLIIIIALMIGCCCICYRRATRTRNEFE